MQAGGCADALRCSQPHPDPASRAPDLQGKTSHCYRIAYRSMERSLTDEEINALQDEVRSTIADKLQVELR